MATDPERVVSAWQATAVSEDGRTQRPVSERDTDRVDGVSVVNPLELEAGVLWALAEEAVRLLRDISDVGR